MMKGFIYITTNTVNNKKYIGKKYYQYRGAKRSYWEHYLGSSKLLKEDIERFGTDNFTREIIDEAETKEELAALEKYYIDKHNAVLSKDYYNLSNNVDKFFTTDESIQKMLETRERWSDEKRAEVSEKLKKRWSGLSDEERQQRIKNMSKPRGEGFAKTRSRVQKKVWASYSDDKKSKILKKRSKSNQQHWQSLTEEQKQEHHKKREGGLDKAWKTNRRRAVEFNEREVILINVKTGDEVVMSIKNIKLKYGIPHNTILGLLRGNYSTQNLYKRTWTLKNLT